MTSRPSKVEVIDKTTVFEGYFKLDRFRLRHELYAGGWSQEIEREVFHRGHASAVLPYDPARDQVVLIEQFRAGVHVRGDEAGPWLLEIVAGVIGEGETPDEVARRETAEEAGLTVDELVYILGYYSSPGALTEYVDVYCARVDSGAAGGIHGLDDEHEDIRVVVMSFDEAMALLAEGGVRSSSAVIALQWLALNRAELRARWS
jgi:ADP-ribose pyrophosphatase